MPQYRRIAETFEANQFFLANAASFVDWMDSIDCAYILATNPDSLTVVTSQGNISLSDGEWCIHEPLEAHVEVVSDTDFQEHYTAI
jgi:hypothetical protein